MVARLADGDATVNELAEPYDVTLQAVSNHLKVLEDAGLVSRSRDALRRPVHLEAEVFDLSGRSATAATRRNAAADLTRCSVPCPTNGNNQQGNAQLKRGRKEDDDDRDPRD